MNKPLMQVLFLEGYSIYQQLQLEEALLRVDDGNWCIINQGTSPAVILGISSCPKALVEEAKQAHAPLSLIRRFSGGGTVVVDENTDFITFICNSAETNVKCRTDAIMEWTGLLYSQVFPKNIFSVRENDYVIADKKCGGNAQYLCKGRWLHHTSFLWNWCSEKMSYLKMPSKMPAYRQKRSHEDFLCRLSQIFSYREELTDGVFKQLVELFSVNRISLDEVLFYLDRPHRKATVVL